MRKQKSRIGAATPGTGRNEHNTKQKSDRILSYNYSDLAGVKGYQEVCHADQTI